MPDMVVQMIQKPWNFDWLAYSNISLLILTETTTIKLLKNGLLSENLTILKTTLSILLMSVHPRATFPFLLCVTIGNGYQCLSSGWLGKMLFLIYCLIWTVFFPVFVNQLMCWPMYISK